MSRLRLSFPAVVLALASLACGGGQKCGEGTHEEGGECVPDEGGGDTSGDGGDDSGSDSGDDSGSDSGDDSGSDSGDDSASDTYTVCGDARGEYLTLAEAVAGLGSGGTITMCEGTFAGADFQDGEFEVIGAGADATWIDLGEQTGITLRGSTVRIESLTLTATPDGEEPSVELFDSTLELRDGAVSGVVGAEGGYNVAFFSLDSAMLDIDHWVFEDLVLRQSLVSERDPEDTLHIRRTVFRDIVEEGRTALISYAEGEFQLTNLIFHRVEMAKVGSVLSTDYADEGDEYVRFLVFYDVTGGPSTYPRAELTILENVRWADPSNCHYCAVTDSDFTAADLGDEGSEDLDCRLVDPENGDFRLESSSPCRDFVSHYEDVDGSDADIGAYGGPYGAW